MMRRYTLRVAGRDFVVDVQERDGDRFEVIVDGQAYAVELAADQSLEAPSIVPLPAARATPSVAAPVAPPAGAGAAAASRSAVTSTALRAPMPGVILELFVQAGDVVKRGQQVAVLDAMKMHNFIGAPRDGTVAEVCVAAGQAVGHGDAILRFAP